MLRLVALSFLFLTSSLCVFKAPQFHLWYLSIMVTEFPWVFMAVTVLVLLLGLLTGKYAITGTCIGMLALLLFASPVIRAYLLSGNIDTGFEAAFGNEEKAEGTPFRFWRMITGINEFKDTYVTKTYKTVDGGPLTLDYYRASQSGLRPCLIVVHGGSWSGGDSRQLPELNNYMARAGYHVVTINYRLAPKYISPAAVDDLYDAIHYLKVHAAEMTIDTTRFVLLGRSAGAQIAQVAAYQMKEANIKGIIDIYGPADMIWGYHNPNTLLVMNSCKVMETYLGGTYNQFPQRYAESSPVEYVKPGIPPTLIIHGCIDPLVAYEHTPRLIKQLEKVGAKYYFLSLPWGTHGCDYTLNGPGGQLSTYVIDRFMKVVTK